MSVEIKIPSAGESITEVVVSQWMKDDGDWVEKDEAILELETDKVNQELTSPEAGILRISASEGETLEIGSIVGHIEAGEKPAAAAKAPSAEAKKEESKAKEQPAPRKQETPAPSNSRTDESAKMPDASKEEKENKAETASSTAPLPGPPVPPPAHRRPAHEMASPFALRLAADYEVSVYDIQGTGRDGLVTSDDVKRYVQNGGAKRQRHGAAGSPPLLSPPTLLTSSRTEKEHGTDREITRERMTQLRKRIAARLVEAQQTAAMLTTFNECDMTAVMAVRAKYKDVFKEKHGVGLGFMSFFVKAAVEALRAYPRVNAFIEKDEVVYHHYMDIGVAVGTDKGLVVPV
ncbi:MAG: 2-oxo acid dehydrogenase subunit E2, partial [Candidatus Sumerlaeia bacterium]|nr:2-oxo acid dehydrogenase subunit E2 [Candidatus Sumerlaeia bacterium]